MNLFILQLLLPLFIIQTPMDIKKVEQIIAPPQPHMVGDGFRVHNFIPSTRPLSMQRMDPFILMDYNSKFYFPPTDQPRGVSVHPHKGFETVTLAYHGKVAHHDSAGNSGVIGEGEVQWMTAASGILHKEYHEKEFSQKGGYFQMVQLWVNLPAKHKLSPPKYQGISRENIQVHTLTDGSGSVEVVAGQYKNTKGSASTFTPIHLYTAKLNTNGTADFSFPETYNTCLLVIEGNLTINNNETVNANHFALFENKGSDFTVKATENTIVLILSGEPINEPIAAQGPFVMNTREELMEAYDDFQNGAFGYLQE